ncbi:MAG: chloride channel protein [Bacteroidetes bacterium]|nr:chloride channel protein [Bacteroidota bacterium]MBS1757743.1 chloride channel protein [Bacteroidota bacterium]
MNKKTSNIPISISLGATLKEEDIEPLLPQEKTRVLRVTFVAVLIAVCISFIAKFLIYLIYLVTNISFYGSFSLANNSPADNHLGLWVIAIPTLGGVVVGLMALYGSKAIRGHGIPEAMEQILTNKSKIKPTITYLKPISSAISIGTGGPFGAEGPIIATGGALGSTLGQLIKITHNERKILLAAGATAGMAAIFGSPIAGIFLAIELLLFEFSPRSIIPVALACITGAAGHHFLFGSEPVFEIKGIIPSPSNTALALYSGMGLIVGLLAVLVTKIVYFIEDGFEKLPIHWMWWPAIGGIAVGIVGYFAPHTLGVGYENITNVLSGNMPAKIIISLCLLKFISWAIALGSGTSGGTLAPLLTIGGATGALIGMVILHFWPNCGINISLAALVGMSAMFAGASRALITSIIFALETTGQSSALVALLAACVAAYIVSFFLMENTIMTEKIARRGIKTPDSYEPDILDKINVIDVMQEDGLVISENNEINEVRNWLIKKDFKNNYFIICNDEGEFKGVISSSDLFSLHHDPQKSIATLINKKDISIALNDSLRTAAEMMAKENLDVLPIVSAEDKNSLAGILTYRDIINAYKLNIDENEIKRPSISLKRNGLKILLKGQQLISSAKSKVK